MLTRKERERSREGEGGARGRRELVLGEAGLFRAKDGRPAIGALKHRGGGADVPRRGGGSQPVSEQEGFTSFKRNGSSLLNFIENILLTPTSSKAIGSSLTRTDGFYRTFKCRTIQKFAPRPPHASCPPSRAALLPASTAWHYFVLSMAVPRRNFSAQSPRRQLKLTKSNTTTLIIALKVTWLYPQIQIQLSAA